MPDDGINTACERSAGDTGTNGCYATAGIAYWHYL